MSEPRRRHTNKANSSDNSSIPNNDETSNDRVNQRKLPTNSLRILSHLSVITSLLVIVLFSTKNEKIKPFARQTDVIAGKGEVVECSQEYFNEIINYDGCSPRECKRFVTDTLLSSYEVDKLLTMAKKGLKLGGSSGGASILDLHSGALSMGEKFVNLYRLSTNVQTFTESDFNAYRIIKDKIKYSLAHHFELNPNKIYLAQPTFFSRLTSKKPVTIHDEYWHPHVDKESYRAFHYTTLLYLSDYNIDFKGGRFVFVDEMFNKTVEPRKGRISMFTSGQENVHYVEKVTSGTRYAITISFTCEKQYAIEDPTINKFNKK